MSAGIDQHGHCTSIQVPEKQETVSKMKEEARKNIKKKLNMESKLITGLAHHLKETPYHRRGKFCDDDDPYSPPKLNKQIGSGSYKLKDN